MHALVLRGVDDEEAGRYRRGQVRISGSEHVPPEAVAVPGLMKQLVEWLNDSAATLDPVERAALAHFRLVDILLFADGNGRTARLLMNLTLMRDGYPPAVVRRDERLEYYGALDAAHAGETVPFVALIAAAVERSLDAYLAASAG
jgi:Fic family protein